MPTINISLHEDDLVRLQEEYKQMAIAWLKSSSASLPPTFEEWVGSRALASSPNPDTESELEAVRILNTIEKLITILQPHRFGLTYLGKRGSTMEEATGEFAKNLVADLKLSPQQSKRIEELVQYYAKDGKEIADIAHVGITNRTYNALHEAYQDLVARTTAAQTRLGEDRAIGRVEGAIAILVSMNVMERKIAKERTEGFKLQTRLSLSAK